VPRKSKRPIEITNFGEDYDTTPSTPKKLKPTEDNVN